MLTRAPDRRHRRAQALVAGHAELAFQVQVGRGDEHVNAAPLRGGERPASAVDVFVHAPGQRGDDRPVNLRADHPDRFGIGLGGNRETRFDDVDAQGAQLPGELQLLVDSQGKAGSLLAVPERRIEDGQPVGARHWGHSCLPL
jgi:hypothetical protein